MIYDSAYFDVSEMRSHDGQPYPEEWIPDRLNNLFRTLDEIRQAWGGPVSVVSGYRSAAYNQALADASAKRNGGKSGVAPNSQHVQGRAADVRPRKPTVEAVQSLHSLVKDLWHRGKLPLLGGLGYYEGLWIHVDCRSRGSAGLATWTGTGLGDAQS